MYVCVKSCQKRPYGRAESAAREGWEGILRVLEAGFRPVLMDVSLVQCFVEFLCVAHVLGRGGSEVVVAAEILLGTEE